MKSRTLSPTALFAWLLGAAAVAGCVSSVLPPDAVEIAVLSDAELAAVVADCRETVARGSNEDELFALALARAIEVSAELHGGESPPHVT